MAQITRVYY